MSTTIWHNPRCSKSRQALDLLRSRGIEPEVRLYLEDPPSPDELRDALRRLGLPPERLVRVKEAKEEGIADLEGEALIVGLSQHPRAIERPVVLHGDRAALGRPPEQVLDLL